jgi:hypothetical protein
VTFLQRYNAERPNQARTCQNQPPQVAFPDLPVLPRVPEQVDPDGWLAGGWPAGHAARGQGWAHQRR